MTYSSWMTSQFWSVVPHLPGLCAGPPVSPHLLEWSLQPLVNHLTDGETEAQSALPELTHGVRALT